MIKTNMKRIALILALIVSILVTFTACGEKQKEIKLASDVKQEVKDEEKNANKLVKIKDLDLGNMMYVPICWKDDENIVVTEGSGKNKNVVDFKSVHIDDINVYNINIKTSKVDKINTIKDALCGEVGEKDMYGSFLYIKDKKLWMYNAIENTQKSIYDLSDIMAKQKESLKITEDKELLKRIHCGFVFGSDKYVYVMAYISGSDCSMRVIDIKTGAVIKGFANSGYFPHLDNVRGNYSWVYNKNKDSFYISSIYYDVIYECKLGEQNGLKKIKTVGGQIFDISEDGNEIYLNSIYKKGNRSIVKYDIQKDKVTVIANENMNSGGKNHFSLFEDVNVNNSKHSIGYSIQNAICESDNKTISKIQTTSFIGDFDGKEIKNARMLPVEQLDNKNNGNSIMFNKKGDGFIYTVHYFDYNSKDDVTTLYKTKSYIYQIK
ncbi:hypothetical protein [Clostridium aciditolerans]|uniref:Lipoprotein n=1 Tax=Clostridium aciditolerans TaxID=339861 RepID=A0A934HU80_9CLOT|nr:hypothetical protein [Clostridium aciditolerans]MBI6872014.1 hypothetical protein [Clostridium aciditolerans]